jgi:hypothetical protein
MTDNSKKQMHNIPVSNERVVLSNPECGVYSFFVMVNGVSNLPF